MARLSFTLNNVIPPLEETETGEVDTDGGGGCTLGGSDSGSAFGPFLAALALLLAVSLKRTWQKTRRIEIRQKRYR